MCGGGELNQRRVLCFNRLALVLFLMATKVVWMLVQAVRTALPIRKDLRMSSDDILNCRWRKSFGVIDADDCVLEPFRIFRPSGPQPILELRSNSRYSDVVICAIQVA